MSIVHKKIRHEGEWEENFINGYYFVKFCFTYDNYFCFVDKDGTEIFLLSKFRKFKPENFYVLKVVKFQKMGVGYALKIDDFIYDFTNKHLI